MNDYELWFAMANLNYCVKRKLIDYYKNAETIWYEIIYNERKNFFDDRVRNILKNTWNKEDVTYIKNKIKNDNIQTVVINNEGYPKSLSVYDDAPYMLFYKGDIKHLNENVNVSIVGSRKYTSYGENVANIISDSLCDNNISIVSGMARGIDSVAHLKCVQKNSYTCAVLGSGLDVIYPKENLKLYNKILENGCIISQFLPGTKPYAYNFPIRNRIISGLSSLIIIIEAGIKSGSLITATSALEQGKDVMAVPGNVFSSESLGTNKLIKDGAYVFTDIEDIYEVLKINNYNKRNVEENKLDGIEKEVWKHIGNNPIHFDDILKLTKININRLYEILLNLQLNDEVISLVNNYYIRNNKTI